MTGMHGMGVSTPMAAAVADATVGLLIDWHMPKDMTFTIGIKSIIVALGLFCIMGRRGTVTVSVDGASPKLHFSMAPMQTYFAIAVILFRLSCSC